MPWISDAESRILIDIETAYLTPPGSAAAVSLPFNTCDLKVDQSPQKANILGSGRNVSAPFYTNKPITGNLVGIIDLLAIGHILKLIFGAPTTTGSVAPYTHTFKIGASTPSFILEKGWATSDKYYLYEGCKAVGISFSFTQTGQIQYTLSIGAATETYSATSYQATPTTDLSKPATVFDIQDVSVVTEGGSPITTLDELSFNFMNNAVIGFGLGSGGAGTVASEGAPSIDGRIKGMFDGDTIIAKGRAKTESALTLGLTSGSYSLDLAVDELKYSQESPPITGPAGAFMDLSFEGYYYDAAAASAFRAVLINTQASYS